MATVNVMSAEDGLLDEGGPRRDSVWVVAGRTFLVNKAATAALILLALIFLFCFLGPLLDHTNQTQQLSNSIKNGRPSGSHLLGTDQSGFDIVGRLMVAGQLSFEVGFAVAAAVTAIGVIYGAIAGYFGKWLDVAMMRLVDIGLSVPVIFLFIFVSKIWKPSVGLLILVLTLTVWFIPARLVRGETLSLRTREYVQAVRTMGGGPIRIILRHIIPNSIGVIIVNATFQLADTIIILALLSYLGFSIPFPQASWGGMLSDGSNLLGNGYWWEVYPALIIIVLTVVCINLIGDALRDSLDARLQER